MFEIIFLPISTMLICVGKLIYISDEQSLKHEFGMIVSDVGRSICEILVFMNTDSPSVETLEGSLILVTE